MKKEFNRNDLAAIKRAAASIAPLAAKRDKILAKRALLQMELDDLNGRINLFNMPIKEMTGYNAEELVERKDGTYVLRYPDTIVPEEEVPVNYEPAANVADIDDTEKVDEVETAPADAPFDLPY